MSARQTISTACIALLLLLLSSSAPASLGVISIEELTCKAELIVYGTVASVERVVTAHKVAPGHVQILTAIVHVYPKRILKGAAAEPIIVKAIQNMEDSPRFTQGQEVFLFLKQSEDDSSFSIFGLTQGKFDVEDGLVVREQTTVALFMEKLTRIQDSD